MRDFYFNNLESIRDMNCFVVGEIQFPTIEEIIEYEEGDGSPLGELTVKTGNYKNLKFNLKIRIIDRYIKDKVREVTKWLKNIEDNRLSFDYNKCYKVKNIFIKSKLIKTTNCDMEIEITCEPFIYNFYEEYEEISNNTTIVNYGDLEALPIIKFYLSAGQQNINLYVNNQSIQMREVENYFLLDCNRREVLDKDNNSISIKKIGGYFTLQEGENLFKYDGNINKIEILKNERYIE